MPLEALGGGIRRRFAYGERMMIAQIYLQQGDIVPRHSHENEQITYLLSGALHLFFGNNDEQEIIVRAGEMVFIPSNLPHRAIALEDTLDIDVFDPPRQDWLTQQDSYLRG
jgi:quercetin dioxygenase-like cupin family protein